jgi:type II secretory pathway predicted ATPase ExeA
MMKPVNDEVLCAAARMMIDAKGTSEFEVCEAMVYGMLSDRKTQSNIEMLRKVRAL